ncbi:hypothetical protein K504DRAFT_450120 [Pleomassaria siparia CBS 279.74]|uniref:Uncharacterized protein n=1 Tax=Pleomassaria siparia CBS 279.74 TaxID=1314801 RepID=A0A6G1KM05_9PLEO|nr:hypothetical protein K504DRAFT_450120 [Pleomassaria siparia CBS 279.74]
MTDRVTKPRQRKKRETRTAAVVIREDAAVDAVVPIQDAPAPDTKPIVYKQERAETANPLQVVHYPRQRRAGVEQPQRELENAIAAVRWHMTLPTMIQPSQAHNLDVAFVSHFVQLNKGVRPYTPEIPWITHLPTFHTSATRTALKLSIRATAMAFYANIHGNPAIMVDSYRWYTMSLNAQRLSLSKMNSKSIPDDEEVLVPIVLGLYEVYAGTTPTNVFQHLTAATKIIEMRGPQNCSSGVAFTLFKAMRVSDAHKSMIFNIPSIFSTPQWMTVPFIIQSRNAHQYLADILLMIPGCIGLLGMGGSMNSFFSRPIPPHADLGPIRKRTTELMREVSKWAEESPHLTSVSHMPLVVTYDMAKQINGAVVMSSGSNLPTVVLPETFVALTAATYHAVRLILILLQIKIFPGATKSPSTPFGPHTPPQSPVSSSMSEAVESAKIVLDIALFLENTHPVGFDFMRSIFPLVVVAILGPGDEEKATAVAMMERWGESKGVGGLCGAWIHV